MIDAHALAVALIAAIKGDPALRAEVRALLLADADDLIDAKRAASLGVEPTAFRRAVRKGELPASMVGRRYLVRRVDLDAYLAGHRVTPTTAATGDDALDAALAKARAKPLRRVAR